MKGFRLRHGPSGRKQEGFEEGRVGFEVNEKCRKDGNEVKKSVFTCWTEHDIQSSPLYSP
jgi:hypothetical protein